MAALLAVASWLDSGWFSCWIGLGLAVRRLAAAGSVGPTVMRVTAPKQPPPALAPSCWILPAAAAAAAVRAAGAAPRARALLQASLLAESRRSVAAARCCVRMQGDVSSRSACSTAPASPAAAASCSSCVPAAAGILNAASLSCGCLACCSSLTATRRTPACWAALAPSGLCRGSLLHARRHSGCHNAAHTSSPQLAIGSVTLCNQLPRRPCALLRLRDCHCWKPLWEGRSTPPCDPYNHVQALAAAAAPAAAFRGAAPAARGSAGDGRAANENASPALQQPLRRKKAIHGGRGLP
jgi:hypothetical protein